MTGEQFEMLEGISVPTTESFDDEGLERDALGPTVFKMSPQRVTTESYCNSALGWFKVQFEKDLTVPFEIDDIEVKLL